MPAARPWKQTLSITSVLLALLLIGQIFIHARHAAPYFAFDDAYMFHRYAMHLRSGAGISWNPQGPHTYGLTSPLWLIPVLVGSFFVAQAATLLVMLSSLFAAIGIATLAWVCSRRVRTPYLQIVPVMFCILAFPLWNAASFRACASNGMETMLGMTLLALLSYAADKYSEESSIRSALQLVCVATLSFLTRPESAIVFLALPVLILVLSPKEWSVRLRGIITYLGLLSAVLAVYMGWARLYYGTALPLPLYAKVGHGYKGYSFFPNTAEYAENFAGAAGLAIFVLLAFARKADWRRWAPYLVTFALTAAYLFSFLQIMGYDGRYFMPYLPLLIIPAVDAFDTWLSDERLLPFPSPVRFAALMLAIFMLSTSAPRVFISKFGRLQKHGHTIYDRAIVARTARGSLPVLGWMPSNTAFAIYARSLPGHPSLALTEAGIVGDMAVGSRIVDLTGLNDKEIALHGASMDYLLDQKLDVIWLPDKSYTWLRGQMLEDPRFLQQYEVYDGAFDSDVAIRKASPGFQAYTKKLYEIWPKYYPGTSPAEYKIQGVTWDMTPRRIG